MADGLAWTKRGSINPGQNIQFLNSTGVVYPTGHIWCVWLNDVEGSLYWSENLTLAWSGKPDVVELDESNGLIGEPIKAVMKQGLSSLNQVLHLVVPNKSRQLLHYVYGESSGSKNPTVLQTLDINQGTGTVTVMSLHTFNNAIYLSDAGSFNADICIAKFSSTAKAYEGRTYIVWRMVQV